MTANEILTWSAIVVALIAAVGGLITAVVNRRMRGPADAREDQTVENQMLVDVAEKAIQMHDTMRQTAKDMAEINADQLEGYKRQVGELNSIIATQREVIAEIRQDAAARGVSAEERIAVLLEQVENLTRERDALRERIHDYEERIRQNLQTIDESTLTPQTMQELRDRHGLHAVNEQETP